MVIRVDGGPGVGLGHLMRSATLAKAARRAGWQVEMASAEMPDSVAADLESFGIPVLTIDKPAASAEDAEDAARSDPTLMVVDGYRFGEPFFAALDRLETLYAVIADGETPAPAPVAVIDQNPSANAAAYPQVLTRSGLMLGLDYVLLRDEVREAAHARSGGRAPCVFVSMGGSDPLALTGPVAERLAKRGLGVAVALAETLPNRELLAARLEQMSTVQIVDHPDFGLTLARATLAVVGAGTTMWEATHLGVPTVAVVTAANQVAPAAAAADLGLVERVDWRDDASAESVVNAVTRTLANAGRRREMTTAGRDCVDGMGADRVVRRLGALVMKQERQ